MRTLLLIITVLIVFAVGAISQLPLSLVTDRFAGPVNFGVVSGTIWAGQIEDIEVNGEAIGSAAFKLSPLALLQRRAEGEARFEGRGLQGEGRISFDGDLLTLQDSAGRADLSTLGLLDAFGQNLRGTVEARIRSLAFSRSAGCQEADLSASTDAITKSLGAYAARGFMLTGEGYCDGEALVIPLSGSGPDGEVEAEVRVEKSGVYRSRLAVKPAAREMGSFLQSMGFEKRGDTYVTERRGRLEANL